MCGRAPGNVVRGAGGPDLARVPSFADCGRGPWTGLGLGLPSGRCASRPSHGVVVPGGESLCLDRLPGLRAALMLAPFVTRGGVRPDHACLDSRIVWAKRAD